MRIEFVNPFVDASYDILTEVLDISITKEELYLKESSSPIMGVAVHIGVTGEANGRVLLDMNKETALKIASAMNFEELKQFDDIVKGTITELANLITGRAITILHDLGFMFSITPPSIFTGDNMEITSHAIEAFIVPLVTPYGKIEVNVALKEKQD